MNCSPEEKRAEVRCVLGRCEVFFPRAELQALQNLLFIWSTINTGLKSLFVDTIHIGFSSISTSHLKLSESFRISRPIRKRVTVTVGKGR